MGKELEIREIRPVGEDLVVFVESSDSINDDPAPAVQSVTVRVTIPRDDAMTFGEIRTKAIELAAQVLK